MKLKMCVYLGAKFEVSRIILTSFEQVGDSLTTPSPPPPPPENEPLKQTLPTQIRVNIYFGVFFNRYCQNFIYGREIEC